MKKLCCSKTGQLLKFDGAPKLKFSFLSNLTQFNLPWFSFKLGFSHVKPIHHCW